MEVWQAISTQRAVREFDGRLLPPDALDRIVEAGRLAPSSNNEQRWAFITCTNREHLHMLSKLGPYAGHLAEAAAAVAIVTPTEGDQESIAYDAGQATQSMMLAAWDQGIGSVHAAVYDQDKARAALGYPADWRCDYLLSLGYPLHPEGLDRPKPDDARKPARDTVHRERW